MTLQLIHMTARAVCVARIYGVRFALGVPLRVSYGNVLNSLSTLSALYRYFRARIRHEPLVWLKTDHAYPSRAALLSHKRPLEEILIGSDYLSERLLKLAQATKPEGIDLTAYLVEMSILTEEQLYEAMSLQTGLSLDRLDPRQVPVNVARSLPAWIAREWGVLPVRVEGGNLHVASTALPSDELHNMLQRHTRLRVRVQLVTPSNFDRLAEALL